MENVLISIVVPIYNVENFLSRCLESIKEQTYTNIEIILVNDGSTDRSGRIAEDFCKNDLRAYLLNKENGGLSDARNFGLSQAKGKYVCFIDSDDYIDNQMVEKMLKQAEKESADVIIAGYYVDFENENGKLERYEIKQFNKNGIFKCDESINQEILGMFGYAWNKLYRLEYLQKNDYKFVKGLSLIEDTEFNSRVLKKAKIFLNAGTYYHYIQRKRITLGNKQYDNLLDLNIKYCECHSDLLKAWQAPEKIVDEIKVKDYILILKGYIKNVILSNSKDSKKQIKELLKIKDIKYSIESKEYKSIKDKLFCKIIQLKTIHILKVYYKIRNIILTIKSYFHKK